MARNDAAMPAGPAPMIRMSCTQASCAQFRGREAMRIVSTHSAPDYRVLMSASPPSSPTMKNRDVVSEFAAQGRHISAHMGLAMTM